MSSLQALGDPSRQVVGELPAQLGVLEGELDRGLEVAELRAAVVPLALERIGEDGLVREQRGDAIGQLDLTARATTDGLELAVDRRGEHVTADHRKVGRRVLRLWFLDDAPDARNPLIHGIGRDDTVLVGFLGFHGLHAEHAAAVPFEHPRHLPETGFLGVDQVVGQVHEERLVADRGARAQHRVAETQRIRLADEDAAGVGRNDASQRIERLLAALGREFLLELVVGVEMVLDRPLGRAGDEHQLFGAGLQRLFDRVLDQRLVDDRQHLLGTGLGGRQEPGAASRHGKDCRPDLHAAYPCLRRPSAEHA